MKQSVFEAKTDEVFAAYDVEIEFIGKLAGSIPSDPVSVHEMVRRQMLKASGGKRDQIDEIQLRYRVRQYLIETGMASDELSDKDIDKLAEQKAEASVNVFRRNESGLYLASHCVKSAAKESINIQYAKEGWGKTRKGPKNYFVERVFIEPSQIPLMRDGERLVRADGEHLQPGTVSGPQGERSIITQHEWVERPVAKFVLRVLKGATKEGEPDAQQAHAFLAPRWPAIWTLMERNGIGPLRKFEGFGDFVVTQFDERGGAQPKPKKRAA